MMSVQTFTDRTARSTGVRIDGPHAIRSVTFTKQSATSRLRITYRDKAEVNVHPHSYAARVGVHIDGVPVSFLETLFDAVNQPSGQFNFFSVSAPFMTIGYAKNISAGTHTLSSVYVVTGNTAFGTSLPTFGFVSNNPYFIEIEEMP